MNQILNNPQAEIAIVVTALRNNIPVLLNFYSNLVPDYSVSYPIVAITNINKTWVDLTVIENGATKEMAVRTDGNYYRFIIEN